MKNQIPSRVGTNARLKALGMSRIFSASGRGYLIAVTFIVAFLLANYASSPVYAPVNSEILSDGMLDPRSELFSPLTLSAGMGTPASIGEYIVLHYAGQTTPSRATSLESLLTSRGIVVTVYDVTDIEASPELLRDAPATIVDASVGSDSGTAVPQAIIDALWLYDRPVILLGGAGWLMPALSRLGGLPLLTASVDGDITSSGAVYTNYPHTITDGSTATSESLSLPVYPVQMEYAGMVNLTTSSDPSELPILQYLSYPLDTFVLGMEDPSQWTADGENLLVDVVAYATSLSETPTADTLAATQTDGTLEGGLSYLHYPEMSNTYSAVHSAFDLLDASGFASWVIPRQSKIEALLTDLYIDQGATSGFKSWAGETAIDTESTGQGLWLMDVTGLSASFSESEVVAYLAAQQSGGGFADDVVTTFHVTEALERVSSLGSIDTVALNDWLEECYVNADDTGDPERWGGIDKNPTGASPSSLYAMRCLQAQRLIGQSWTQSIKTKEWLWERHNGDGTFDNTNSDGSQLFTGTPSAVVSLEILGDLDSGNRTQSLGWISSVQQTSGGFGILLTDTVGKTDETSLMAVSLEELGETSSQTATDIIGFLDTIETDAGFEGMELIPSLMWGYWLGAGSRYAHAGGQLDLSDAQLYLDQFTTLKMYPNWANITTYLAKEYSLTQYDQKSVWTSLFGVGMADSLGLTVTGALASDTISYLSQRQDSDGHYKLNIFPGSPHMQYSAAAVETLYLLDALDTITYRTELESMVLADYSSGSWSSTGWTLEPYSQSQSAIDWLSTRTAFRLGLVDATMASEIALVIAGRVQYTDLWDLSRDISILSLIDSVFSTDYLACIDRAQVQSALSSAFTQGWYNQTTVWQPVFTSGVLEMISILGLRPDLSGVTGSRITATLASTPVAGGTLDIDLSITSSESLHTVYVKTFGSWLEFTDVSNTDTLIVDIPSDVSVLGPENISVMLWDHGDSRAYDMIQTDITGIITGNLVLDGSTVLLGDPINGTVTWTLQGGGDAGLTNITVRLEDDPFYQEWYYTDVSPFDISVPTDDFSAGTLNLTVMLERTNCEPLVLQQDVQVDSAVLTYITTDTALTGQANVEVSVSFDLSFVGNDSSVTSHVVHLSIEDELGGLVFTDTLISTTFTDTFLWTPTERGNHTLTLHTERNGTVEATSIVGYIEVSEDSIITLTGVGQQDQYTTTTVVGLLASESGAPLDGRQVDIVVTSPSLQIILDTSIITNSTGHFTFFVPLDENGYYSVECDYAGEYLLESISSLDIITSWSDTTLDMGGITAEGLVNTTWDIWAHLTDSQGNPLAGKDIVLTITYLPSTIVVQTTLTTNATGHTQYQWTATSPGSYSIEATYTGTGTLSNADVLLLSDLYIPSVPLPMTSAQTYEVGGLGWVQLSVEDHNGVPLSGITISFVVRDPLGSITYQTSGVTSGGLYNFTFTPSVRGQNTLEFTIDRQGLVEASYVELTIDVYEDATITLSLDGQPAAIGTGTLTVTLEDSSSTVVEGSVIHTLITLDGFTILDHLNTTDALGQVIHTVPFDSLGNLHVEVSITSQDWLQDMLVTQDWTVLGKTSFVITHNGLPVTQGTSVGFTITLTDWEDNPLQGRDVDISVEWSNGTVIDSVVRTTGVDGTCAYGHTFIYVGDFLVRASYAGSVTGAPSATSVVQRVTVTPALVLQVSPTAQMGQQIDIQIGMLDYYSNYIVGRTLILSIELEGFEVFMTSVPSEDGLLTISSWDPTERGLYTIILTHADDVYYLANSTSQVLSVLELVSGTLVLDLGEVDLFDTVQLEYTLGSSGNIDGIVIVFTVLDVDLLPVWTQEVSTNALGVATTSYIADDTYGILRMRAEPRNDQFMTGGGVEEPLTVKTMATVGTATEPSTAVVDSPMNITLDVTDELGGSITVLTITVRVYDPWDVLVLSRNVAITDGHGQVTLTPTERGTYSVQMTSQGSSSVHPISGILIHTHTVHEPTLLSIVDITADLSTGDTFSVTVLLTDHLGNELEGRTVHLSLSPIAGPVDLITDSLGEVTWGMTLDTQAVYMLQATFDGAGVFLGSYIEREVIVRTGTVITALEVSTWAPIAGVLPVTVSFLLEDDQANVLEGRNVNISVYHDQLGLQFYQVVEQFGYSPEVLNLTLPRMGDYTILFSYEGSASFYPTSSAIVVFALGTSSIEVVIPSSLDRADEVNATISVHDEVEDVLEPDGLIIEIEGLDISDRIYTVEQVLDLILTGLPVGNYTLTVVLLDDSERLGATLEVDFSVTARTSLSIVTEDLSGLEGELHSLEILVIDSLGEPVTDAALLVSIWDPTGREIYGSILSTVHSLETAAGVALIEWTPTSAGNYTLTIDYVGSSLRGEANLEMIQLIRYESVLDISTLSDVTYPTVPQFMFTLAASISKIQGAQVTLTIMLGNVPLGEYEVTTDVRRLGQCELTDVVAGNITVIVEYLGSDTYTQDLLLTSVLIYPEVNIDITTSPNLYVGQNITLKIIVGIRECIDSWVNHVQVEIRPEIEGSESLTWNMPTGTHGEWDLTFVPEHEGAYLVIIRLSGIPVIGSADYNYTILVLTPTISIEMDPGATPVVGGGTALAVLGLILRRRLKGTVDTISGEWET